MADAIGAYAPRWEYIEHRKPHRGTDPRELQRRGEPERGSETNQLDALPQVGDELQAFLKEWEQAYPKAEPTRPGTPLPAVQEEQLRALGYID